MIAFTMILEDTVIHATRTSELWEVSIAWTITGEETTLSVKDKTMGALMALATGGDNFNNDELTEALYDIAEPAMQSVSPTLRIIP